MYISVLTKRSSYFVRAKENVQGIRRHAPGVVFDQVFEHLSIALVAFTVVLHLIFMGSAVHLLRRLAASITSQDLHEFVSIGQ